MSLLVTNIGELFTNDPSWGPGPGILRNAALVAEGGRVAWVGPAPQAPAADDVLAPAVRAVGNHEVVLHVGRDAEVTVVARAADECLDVGCGERGRWAATLHRDRPARPFDGRARFACRLAPCGAFPSRSTSWPSTRSGWG